MDLRTQMPNVARLVDERRKQDGVEWVNETIRRAIKGEPNQFYAFEAGHVLGTPFSVDFEGGVFDGWVKASMAWGGKFAMVMRNREASGG